MLVIVDAKSFWLVENKKLNCDEWKNVGEKKRYASQPTVSQAQKVYTNITNQAFHDKVYYTWANFDEAYVYRLFKRIGRYTFDPKRPSLRSLSDAKVRWTFGIWKASHAHTLVLLSSALTIQDSEEFAGGDLHQGQDKWRQWVLIQGY